MQGDRHGAIGREGRRDARRPEHRPPLAVALRRHRRVARLTQEQLAERAGVSVRTVSDLERGVHTTARRATLDRLVRALDLSPGDAAALMRSGRGLESGPPPALPPPLRPHPHEPELIGRDAAWDGFERALGRARLGARVALAFAGEAGIGKSRLLSEIAATLAEAGTTVLGARCDEDRAAPYQAIVDALGPALSEETLAAVSAAAGPHAARLAVAFPGRVGDVRDGGPPGDDPVAGRAGLLVAFDALATAAARVGPTVILVDDLHAADPSTLAVLRHLTRSPRPGSLLLVLAYRDTDVTAGHALTALLDELRRDRALDHHTLTGLDMTALAALVAARTGGVPEADALRELHRQTGGNPFFVEEILTGLAEHTVDAADGAAVPAGARDVVRGRLGSLSAEAREALATAAVIGHTFDPAIVGRVGGARVETGLHEARRRGFVAPVGPRLEFRHGLVRNALLQDLEPAATARIHWQVGEVLEHEHATDLDAHLPEVATHLRLCVSAGDPRRASDLLARLGRLQFRRLALDEAVESLRAALTVLPEAKDDGRRRMGILETLAETQFWRDEPDAMRSAALVAADLARRHGSPEDLGRTAIVAARWNRGGELEAGVLDLLDEAATRLADDPCPMLAQVLAMRAYVLQGAARGFDARSQARAAEDVARRFDEPEALTMALLVQTYTDAGSPDVPRRRRVLDDLVRVAARVPREDHRRQYGVMALRSRAQLQVMAADRAGFEATRAELRSIADALGATFLGSQLLHWDAAVALAEGRCDDATRFARAALETWSARPDARRMHLVQTATIALERGEHAAVLPELERLVAGNTSSIGYAWRAVLAVCLAATGDGVAAAVRAEELAADGFCRLADDHQRPHALRWLAEAIVRVDARAAAITLLPIVQRYEGLVLAAPGIASIECAADRAIAQLLATLGRDDEADVAYSRAADLEEALGFGALARRTREWQARLG
jgi:transcriptional regulator with XRE-family HTH domain